MMRPSSTIASLPRVVIDLEKVRHINSGLGRFALHLGQEMLKVAEGRFQPVFFLPPGTEHHFPPSGYAPKPAVRWQKESTNRLIRMAVQRLLKKSNTDLWHVTNQHSKYLPFDGRVPVILTIHDLNFLHDGEEDVAARAMRRKLALVQEKIDRAAAITTISTFVADDVKRHLDLRGNPLHVVHNGIPPPPLASPSRPQFLPGGPFLLTIGNFLPHKNFHVLLDLIASVPEKRLVIAGKKATAYGNFVEREVSRRGLQNRVVMPGELSDGDRQWLYEECDAFLFPSLTEGFGFPVLEAMQCGKPVFMSRKTSLPEIAGDCGYFFESYDAPAMTATYRQGMEHWAADPTLPSRCRRHAESFSWQASAERYATIYESVLAASAMPPRA